MSDEELEQTIRNKTEPARVRVLAYRERLKREARVDQAAVTRCDVVLAFTDPGWQS